MSELFTLWSELWLRDGTYTVKEFKNFDELQTFKLANPVEYSRTRPVPTQLGLQSPSQQTALPAAAALPSSEVKMNRLTGMRAYLAGAMELEPDNGVQWRQRVGEWLFDDHGVIIMDPTDKPIDLGREDLDNRDHRQALRRAEDYDAIAQEMREIRCVDLDMIDISDFMIVHLDKRVQTCGTWEELFWANRLKKPILIHYEQGKKEAPDWLFGTVDHRHIFSTWDELAAYVQHVATNILIPGLDKRWRFYHPRIHRKEKVQAGS